ncbi:MAG: hypothetical protein LKK07_08275 [Lactococcus lactis]|nr:hypothetical protein [Lactococcus lactis]MCI2139587.1 hypothetical protein [Lactococcus lactis]MCI2189574.1 hypothetical protein [Lactococcus lactis]
MSDIYDVTGDYKGFKQNPYSDNNRFRGYRVHLYNNKNGKYGYVERGKDCQNTFEGFELQLRFTFEHAIDCLLDHDNTRNYTCYKFTDEYIQGYYMGLGDGIMKLLPKPQPQLTIPKSIAESKWMKHLILCSSITQFEFERYDFLDKEEERVLKWVNTGKNENILYIYLASKRIGVDLVKVVEG